MTTTAIPNKPANVNLVGLGKADYKGAPSTLCNGCGHDSIASQIIAARARQIPGTVQRLRKPTATEGFIKASLNRRSEKRSRAAVAVG